MKIAYASDTEKARKLIESKACNLLVISPDSADRLKTLNTIITPLLARFAKENHVAIGIDARKISKISSPLEKARTLARLREVIAYCRKKDTVLATNLQKRESQAFLISLGASTTQASSVLTQAF